MTTPTEKDRTIFSVILWVLIMANQWLDFGLWFFHLAALALRAAAVFAALLALPPFAPILARYCFTFTVRRPFS
jgi:hypothetical protein